MISNRWISLDRETIKTISVGTHCFRQWLIIFMINIIYLMVNLKSLNYYIMFFEVKSKSAFNKKTSSSIISVNYQGLCSRYKEKGRYTEICHFCKHLWSQNNAKSIKTIAISKGYPNCFRQWLMIFMINNIYLMMNL